MTRQPNRLAASLDHKFSGDLIDRSFPARFTLNGREFQGFEGDSVLSAVLAAGVDTAGTRYGQPLALDERFAPPVMPVSQDLAPQRALPMERTPIVDGMELKLVGGPDAAGSNLFGRLFGTRSLGQKYDHSLPMPGAWVDLEADREIEADLLVVGGGIAGLAAASRAAHNRKRVVLVERFQALGGSADFYGASEGEDVPDEVIDEVIANLESRARVTILIRAEVVWLGRGTARVHQVIDVNGRPAGRTFLVKAADCVIATGAQERLPVFPGNRLPGVSGVLSAYRLARRYGVWTGRDAVFSFSINPAYRLVLLANAAGIHISRLSDTRIEQRSAYFGYAQALAIPMAPGLLPVDAQPAGRGELDIRFAVALDEKARPGEPVRTSRLVTASAAQPDLTLWLQAGGDLRWDEEVQAFQAQGELPGIALAGSAAGYLSFSACRQSGEAAADLFAGRNPQPIDDSAGHSDYESSNGPVTIAAGEGEGASYLDWGVSLATRGPIVRRRMKAIGARPLEDASPELDERALGIADVAARVQLGEIKPGNAGSVTAERCVVAQRITPLPEDPGQISSTLFAIAPYLSGRFGEKPRRWIVICGDRRHLSIGGLIFPRTDLSDPEKAIGVVLGENDAGAGESIVLIDADHANAGDRVTIQDISGPAEARLDRAYRPEKIKNG